MTNLLWAIIQVFVDIVIIIEVSSLVYKYKENKKQKKGEQNGLR